MIFWTRKKAAPVRLELPIFPLNTVLFPGGLLPLRVFETRYMDMTRECMKAERPFGVCLIKSGEEVGKPAEPEPFGVLAHIVDWDMRELGLLHLSVRGGRRFRILSHGASPQGLVTAQVELLPEEQDAKVPDEYDACVRLLRMIIADQAAGTFLEPLAFDSAIWVSNRLSEVLPVPLAAKQKLLEFDGAIGRLQILQRYLEGRGLVSQKK